MLGPPPSSSTDEVCLQGAAGGWCWRKGRLGRGRWGVMAEKGGRGRYLGPQNLPSAWSLPTCFGSLLLVPLDSSFPAPSSATVLPLPTTPPSPELPVHPPLESFFTQGDSRKAFQRGSINHTVLLQTSRWARAKPTLLSLGEKGEMGSCTRCRHKPSLQHQDTLVQDAEFLLWVNGPSHSVACVANPFTAAPFNKRENWKRFP